MPKIAAICIAGFATVAGCAAHAATPGKWVAVNEGGTCMQMIQPTAGMPMMVGLSGNGSPMVMVTLASKTMPQLGPGAYQGLMRFDSGETESLAAVQRPDKEMVVVAMMIPAGHLDALALFVIIHVRLDGRRLTDVAPPGRVQAVADLRKCLARLPARPAAGKAATPARPAPPPGGRSTDAALAAALAAGNRAAGQSPPRPAQGAGPGAFPQGQADTMLMMMRMNNRLMNNGGNMADPSMGAVMQGLEY